MGRFIFILVALLGVLLVAGAGVLAFLPMPAPSTSVERVIPNDRFLQR